jgi:hypothetical protein
MTDHPFKAQIIKGKYQITKNIFVICYLSVLEANDHEIKTFLRIKGKAAAMVSIGTKIYFDANPINKMNVMRQRDFDVFSITVKQIEDMDGKPVHVCTPIHKESRPELRAAERKETNFLVSIANSSSQFQAMNGCSQGLSLLYKPNRAMISLSLDRSYNFSVPLKDEIYLMEGKIKHIQYNWETHHHIIGVHFPNLSKDHEIVLNRLIDPDYKIDISTKSSIDTSAGKISIDD